MHREQAGDGLGRVRTRARGVFFAVRVAAAVALVFVGVGWLVWRLVFALPAERDALALVNEIIEREAALRGDCAFDSDRNGFLRYRALVRETLGLQGWQWDLRSASAGNGLYASWVDAMGEWALANPLVERWDDPALDRGKAALADLAPLLDALDHAAAAPMYRSRFLAAHGPFATERDSAPAKGRNILLPHLRMYRELGVLNLVAMRDAANRADWDEFQRRAETGIRHARQVSREVFLISTLVGISIEAATLQEVRLAVLEHAMPAARAAALRDSILALGDGEGLLRALRAERAMYPLFVREEVTVMMSGSRPWQSSFWSTVTETPPAQVALRDSRRYFAQAEARASLTPALRAVSPGVDAGAAGWYTACFDTAMTQADALVTLRAATLAMLEIERFVATHGRLPDSLDSIGVAAEPVTLAPFEFEPAEAGDAYTLRIPHGARHMRHVSQRMTAARGEK